MQYCFGSLVKKEHKIVAAAAENKQLVKISENKPDIPIARLVEIDGVLFIKPLKITNDVSSPINIAAPRIAILPLVISAQRWHHRLGNLRQSIFKKTAEHSEGFNGIDVADLTTYETCHLSKAQRVVSR